MAEVSIKGAKAVHDFLVARCPGYEQICKDFPKQTAAMEMAWVITGIQADEDHRRPHPTFISNLKAGSGSWRALRAQLKTLMVDSVSPSRTRYT